MPNSFLDTDAVSAAAALLEQLGADHPNLALVPGSRFAWRAGSGEVQYVPEKLGSANGIYALLHEFGHALLHHTDYQIDFELLRLEVNAWEQAKVLAGRYGIPAPPEIYIQDCLDSYRDWLHLRATCPSCQERCLQSDAHSYHCSNCSSTWRVSRSRLCRPYRLQSS